MKIGVITFWQGNSNYGQILQCWALQQYLKELGHSPYVIRFSPRNRTSPFKRFLGSFLPVDFIKLVLLNITKPNKAKQDRLIHKNDKKRNFEAFRKDHLCMSKRVYRTIKQLRHNPPVADVYIVGSDQVWAQLLSKPDNYAYFLDFGSKDIRRISYAPSFVFKNYPIELLPNLKSVLKSFNALSAREYSGVEILKNLGFYAEKVLDPTLLLSREDYLALIPKSRKRQEQIQDYIFVYSLNIKSPGEIRWEELKAYSDKERLNIKVTPASGYFVGRELFGNNVEYNYSSPGDWLGLINDAQLVVTTSFHGVVFSIILQKPFIYIPLEGRFKEGNSRVFDLLTDIGLEDRILSHGKSYNEIIDSEICWDKVKVCLEPIIQQSSNFIYKSISEDATGYLS